jgi:hypothetical protein
MMKGKGTIISVMKRLTGLINFCLPAVVLVDKTK